jgi:hypothetical protein
MSGTNRPKRTPIHGIGEAGDAEAQRRHAIEEALERMLFEEREEEGKWLREKELLKRYKSIFTKGWIRKTRRLMRKGIDPQAGPMFSTCGRLVWYEVAEIERWLREHRLTGNGAK